MGQWKNFLMIVFKWALLVAVGFAIFFFVYGFTPAQTCYFLYGKAQRVYASIAYEIEDTSDRISTTVSDPNYHINATADTLEARSKAIAH
ncbi:MAG: hypothetical protein ILP11_03510 [Alphaproteobacteria bacterium]|nr:hypothetical protein [Alphaproteobacteria bacterium]